MFAPSILNTHLDKTVTLDSDMITKDTFVSRSTLQMSTMYLVFIHTSTANFLTQIYNQENGLF